MSTETLLREALLKGRCLHLDYNGGHRLVEVHAIGTTKAGNPCFRGFQVGGASSSGEYKGWKMFLLSEVEDVALTDVPSLAPREGYKKGDKGMIEIDLELEEAA